MGSAITGGSVAGGGAALTSTVKSASVSSDIVFLAADWGSTNSFRLFIDDMIPSTETDPEPQIEVSDDGGSTWISTGINQCRPWNRSDVSAAQTPQNRDNVATMHLLNSSGGGTTLDNVAGISAVLDFVGLAGPRKQISGTVLAENATDTFTAAITHGTRITTGGTINAIRIKFKATVTITTGTFRVVASY